MQNVQVRNEGLAVLAWNITATTLSGGDWLTVGPLEGATEAANPATVDVQVNPVGLAAGAYFGLVEVAAPDAASSPQFVTVVLDVRLADQNPGPIITPASLIFSAVQGEDAPPAQAFEISNPPGQPMPFTLEAVTLTGGQWLGPAAADGMILPGDPTPIAVEVLPAELAPGTYHGSLRMLLGGEFNRAVDVVLVVTPGEELSLKPAPVLGINCMRTQVTPVFTLLGGTSPVPAGWPTSIEVAVVDDCGVEMNQGTVVVDFSGVSSPSLALSSSGGGLWTSTWNVPSVEAQAAASPSLSR